MKEKRHYTNQERRRIYAAPKVKLKNTPVVPKQRSSTAIRERKHVIGIYMSDLDEKCYCNAIGDYVYFIKKSIKETMEHAAGDARSTLFAANLDSILEGAVKIRNLIPNSKGQRAFSKIHLLICPIKRYGYAKVTIGELHKPFKQGAKYVHYCVTAISLREIKK